MKKRVLLDMCDGVYRVVVQTEDWSEGDITLMDQYGEPEVDVGGEIAYTFRGESRHVALGEEYVRLRHGFPYARRFDSRDLSSVDEAMAIGKAWKDMVLGRIDAEVRKLRENTSPLPTEEISEI